MNTQGKREKETTPRKQHDQGRLDFVRRHASLVGRYIGWSCCEQVLAKDDCAEMIELCRDFPIVPPNTVGEEGQALRRQVDTRKIGVNARTQWIFDLVCKVADEANGAGAGLELTEINRAPQYCEYKPGWGHFDWHDDYSHDLDQVPRKFTIIIQLSAPDEYEGGRLQVFGTEIEDLPRERGAIIAFPSFLPHRVTPVTKGTRKVLASWIAGPRLR